MSSTPGRLTTGRVVCTPPSAPEKKVIIGADFSQVSKMAFPLVLNSFSAVTMPTNSVFLNTSSSTIVFGRTFFTGSFFVVGLILNASVGNVLLYHIYFQPGHSNNTISGLKLSRNEL